MIQAFDISMSCLALTGTERWWDVLISVGVFASVFMLIVAVFSQAGTVELSPQRQAVLATGHSDRKTVFEMPLLQPIMWMLLCVSHRLAMPSVKRWLAQKLTSSGNEDYYTPEEYLSLSLLTGLSLAFVIGAIIMVTSGQLSVVRPMMGLVAGVMLTLIQVHSRASKRLRLVTKRVPYTLDLIALAMGAGATFTEAIGTVVREKGSDPFNVELRTVLAEMDLGSTRRQALENLVERVPIDMLRSIVASIIQAEELGTPLADVLHSEATLMRLQRSVRAENAAAVAAVRMLLPGILIMMSVMLVIFGPAIVRAMKQGLF